MKQLTVLWISHFFPRPDDHSRGTWAFETIRTLATKGVSVVVLVPTPWIPKAIGFTKAGESIRGIPDEYRFDNMPVFYPKCPHYPHRFLRRFLFNYVPYFEGSYLWPWCRRSVDTIMRRYSPDLVHANFVVPAGMLASRIKKEFGIPYVLQERSVQAPILAHKHFFYGKLYRSIMSDADAILTNNERSKRLIAELLPVRKEITFVRSAANQDTGGYLTMRPARYEGKKVVLCVGSFKKRRKGQQVLIEAIKRIERECPELHCIMIGSGVYLKEAKALVGKYGLGDKVEFLGSMPHSNVLQAMSWCDVFALPSWDESFGSAYCEAMAFGKPIIATRGEGIGDITEHGVSALLVERQNPLDLGKALLSLVHDEDLSSRLGLAARDVVEKELNYSVICDRIRSVYDNLLA